MFHTWLRVTKPCWELSEDFGGEGLGLGKGGLGLGQDLIGLKDMEFCSADLVSAFQRGVVILGGLQDLPDS